MLVIRPAEPADALSVARVHVRSWQAAYRGLLPEAFLASLRPEDRAARYTFGDPDPSKPFTVLAFEGETLVGFASTRPSADVAGAGELSSLYVDPDHWAQGAGKQLIAVARDRLQKQGFSTAVLWLLDGNARGARFYTGDGWRCDEVGRDEVVWGVRVRDVRWSRALP